jgi:alkylation response protein AidB-like acyl-CoA dehydrogenase
MDSATSNCGISPRYSREAEARDRDGAFPAENFVLLHRRGLLALTVPSRFGGGGAGLSTAMRVVAAVARGERRPR